MTGVGGYPVQVTVTQDRDVNRLWGIPFIGVMVRFILAIPLFLILLVYAIGLGLGMIVVWIPILFLGKVPGWWCGLVTSVVSRQSQIGAYIALMPGGYPPFGGGQGGAVTVTVPDGGGPIGRLWGIPYFGLLAREIALIPHLIVLLVLEIVLYVLMLVLWIPILINGKYPEFGIKFMGLFLRYAARVAGWMLFLPAPYPPFDFDM